MNNSFVRCFIKIFSTKCCPSSSQWNKRLRRGPCGRLETTSGRTVPSPGACAERDPGSRDARRATPRRPRPSPSRRRAPAQQAKLLCGHQGAAGPGGPRLQPLPHTGSAPQGSIWEAQGLAAEGDPQVHRLSATWGHCAWPAVPAGQLSTPEPPQSHGPATSPRWTVLPPCAPPATAATLCHACAWVRSQ